MLNPNKKLRSMHAIGIAYNRYGAQVLAQARHHFAICYSKGGWCCVEVGISSCYGKTRVKDKDGPAFLGNLLTVSYTLSMPVNINAALMDLYAV